MTTNQPGDSSSAATGKAASEAVQEPSLGPACLVVVVLMLAACIAICTIGSFLVFRDQVPLAVRGISESLIPWVESSNLAPEYKRQIVADLSDTLDKVKTRELTGRQLSRLKSALEDNPVLLWGNVEGIMAQAESVGMPANELEAARRTTQRLLRAAAMRKIGRNDLIYMLEGCTHTRTDGEGLEVNTGLTADDIRKFLGRAEKMINGMEVPNEPFEKSVPEVFRGLIDEALSVK